MPLGTFNALCLDATDADTMGAFWSSVLGLELLHGSGEMYMVEPVSGSHVWINAVPEPKTVKNRIHLDVHCASVDDLLSQGAVVLREPIENEPWWVLADPDGGELCAFVREVVPVRRLYEVVVDCENPAAIARWWADLLGVDAQNDNGSAWFVKDVPKMPFDCLVFDDVSEPKLAKNRVHWDVDTDDLHALVNYGATLVRGPIDGAEWHVLADPEGNEFCAFLP